jgi:hypothetical protein
MRSSPRNARLPKAFMAFPVREPIPGIVLEVRVDPVDDENPFWDANKESNSDSGRRIPIL